jgi:flagellar assembly factor FliW
MAKILIQGTELEYNDADIITFDEGLVGLPHLRRMVLAQQSDIAPFLWMASLDEPDISFLLVHPNALYPGYAPGLPAEVKEGLSVEADEKMTVLAICLIQPDWTHSTVNLRAPLYISAEKMRGAQVVLTETSYRVDEPMPIAQAA